MLDGNYTLWRSQRLALVEGHVEGRFTQMSEW